MERDNRVIDNRYSTKEEQEWFIQFLEEKRRIGRQPMTGDVVRTIHEWHNIKPLSDSEYAQISEVPHPYYFSKVIKVFKSYMLHKYGHLNITNKGDTDPHRIHIVFPIKKVDILSPLGVYLPLEDMIYLQNINAEKRQLSTLQKRLHMTSTLVHECFHQKSFKKLILRPDQGKIGMLKNGYQSFDQSDTKTFSRYPRPLTLFGGVALFQNSSFA